MVNRDEENNLIHKHWEDIDIVIQIVRQRVLNHNEFKTLEYHFAEPMLMDVLFSGYPDHEKMYLSCNKTQQIVFFLEHNTTLSSDKLLDLAITMSSFQDTKDYYWHSDKIVEWNKLNLIERCALVFAFSRDEELIIAAIPISSILKQDIRIAA